MRRNRRIPVNVTLDPETAKYLQHLGDGNRSAAVEELVRQERIRRLTDAPTI